MRRLRYLRVLGKETGRLLNLRSLAIVGVLTVIFFFIFMEYYSDFTHSHSAYEEYAIAQRMLEEYGDEIDADEYADFKTWLTEYEDNCEEWIVGNPTFENVGVYSYADYEELYHRGHAAEVSNEENRAIWALLDDECDYARFYVQAHEEIDMDYQMALDFASNTDLIPSKQGNPHKFAREVEYYESGEYKSVFPDAVNIYTEQYLAYLAVLCVLSVMFIAAPAAVTDRITEVDNIQRSTRHGRLTAVTRLGGAVLASFAVASTEILVATAILFVRSGCGVFWNCRMDSFMSTDRSFSATTFGQHYIGSMLIILALSMAASLLSCVMSSLSRSMVSVILKLAPTFIVFTFVCDGVVNYRGMFSNVLYRFTGIPCAPLLCVLLLLIGAGVVCGVYVKKELKCDV